MHNKDKITPVRNCCVRDNRFLLETTSNTADKENSRSEIGYVVEIKKQTVAVTVKWQGRNQSDVPVEHLRSGFKPGMAVWHSIFFQGEVKSIRTVAGQDQVLVEFGPSSQRLWLPFYSLARKHTISDAFVKMSSVKQWKSNNAERFRLSALAKYITYWSEMTGALNSFDIDPLPHQIHLVHHIQNSGQPNWLIADDVGLGKTIETGMLIHARQQRQQASRILLITPAGLTRQWQEELHNKFKLSEFKIYGRDFNIHEERQWRMYPHVIASIDVLKQEGHLASLITADAWDMVIVDEAHRLSRRQYGLKLESSQRFELIAALREYDKIKSLILLSATPHQGMPDKFQALLELLNPNRREEIQQLADNPSVLSDMVFRNCKADVTDSDGNFIFHGKSTLAVNVPINQPAREFDQALQAYLKQGYEAGSKKGNKGNAIGFVMTTYRKLAASSVASIELALHRRLKKLIKNYQSSLLERDLISIDIEDERFQGEMEERIESAANEFFYGEIDLLKNLILKAQALRHQDEKLHQFKNTILNNILSSNADEKVLIFTEYRATQSYLAECLSEQFGEDKVCLIHGAMSHDERRVAIEEFENSGQFLLSTEAGGEGINLQKRCHVMVNYDLPWNPMRLVQRIGRLYRYGQKNKVVVFNISAKETVDDHIIDLMYRRIASVVEDLAIVQGNEYNEALKDDILGQVSDLIDLEGVLEAALETNIQRTEERINDAVQRASQAAELQTELFESVGSFEKNALKQAVKIDQEHLKSFLLGMCNTLGIEYQIINQQDQVYKLRLPEKLTKAFSTKRTNWEVCFCKEVASKRPKCELMDMNSLLFVTFIAMASKESFGGSLAAISTPIIKADALVFAELHWQNDLGSRTKSDFKGYLVKENKVIHSVEAISEWLLLPTENGDYDSNSAKDKNVLNLVSQKIEQDLAMQCDPNSMPERHDITAAGWL